MKSQESDRLTPARLFKLLDDTLLVMIDQWYENVCSYYETNPPPDQEPELKRFHDDKGHRIKFAKDMLQCTYGLRVLKDGKENSIEISVNNKVEAFDYDEFFRRLDAHYRGQKTAPRKPSQQSPLPLSSEVFQLEADFDKSFSVEHAEGKADVVRLNFRVDPQGIAELARDPSTLTARIEDYCLSPLRRIYADLYRRSLQKR